jgi:Na+/H+ antiporter NhaD/arsenite permease-like protein
MSDAFLSTAIMLLALIMFVSDRIRPDAVALIVLLLAWMSGLVSLEDALAGFGSPAVLIVAAVLVVGRAVEYTGGAQAMTAWLIPNSRFATIRIGGVLLMGTILSAFMNNIAALAITMPIALTIARDHKLPPGAVLMPLAFATILGGMTTLIGTPANLIISSVREDTLGEPFGMFSMTPVAAAVAGAGLLYLMLLGWRIAPRRASGSDPEATRRVLTFELAMPIGAFQGKMTVASVRAGLRGAGASLLAVLRDGERARLEPGDRLRHDDRVLVMSREHPWTIAEKTKLIPLAAGHHLPDRVTAHVSVIHGSSLIGQGYGALEALTGGEVELVAGGPRAARLRRPIASNTIEAGDQLFLRGAPHAIADLVRRGRLLEVGRQAPPVKPGRPALIVIGIYAAAVLLAGLFGLPPTATFIGAALAICLLRLLPPDEAYRSVDLAGDRAARRDDSDRPRVRRGRRQRRHRRRDRLGGRRHASVRDAGDDRRPDHDPHRLPQQRRDGSGHGPGRRRRRRQPRHRSRRGLAGGADRLVLRLPHAHRPPEQPAGDAPGQLPIHGLSQGRRPIIGHRRGAYRLGFEHNLWLRGDQPPPRKPGGRKRE